MRESLPSSKPKICSNPRRSAISAGWAVPSAWVWPDCSFSSGLVRVERANSRYSQGDLAEPTKTGNDWTIKMTVPLRALLLRQRALSRAGRPEGWVFPNSNAGPLDYHNWRRRGWIRALERAKVQPREGDAQKALRRSYITSALICGRNAKQVASDVGHATLRMVVEQYDSFVDPAAWPDEDERERLRTIYGWTSVPATSLQSATETQTRETPSS